MEIGRYKALRDIYGRRLFPRLFLGGELRLALFHQSNELIVSESERSGSRIDGANKADMVPAAVYVTIRMLREI